jgi:DNA-binding transcriptional LysR family regulator
LKTSLLQVDKLCAFVSKNHVLTRQDSITLSELATHPFIVTGRDSGVREILEDALRRAKRPLTIAFETNYMSTALGLAKEGLGVAILPEVVADMDNSGDVCRLAIVRPVLSRRVDIIEKKDRSLSSAAVQFVKILRQVTAAS